LSLWLGQVESLFRGVKASPTPRPYGRARRSPFPDGLAGSNLYIIRVGRGGVLSRGLGGIRPLCPLGVERGGVSSSRVGRGEVSSSRVEVEAGAIPLIAQAVKWLTALDSLPLGIPNIDTRQ
jgi:hypothetical protein